MERRGRGWIDLRGGRRGRGGGARRRARADRTPARDLHGPAGIARVRAEVAGLFGDAARAARIERDLAAIPGVVSARASARTGRVLVRVGEDAADEAALVLGAHAVPGAPPPPSARRAVRAMAEGVGALVRAARRCARPREGTAGEDERRAWQARAWGSQVAPTGQGGGAPAGQGGGAPAGQGGGAPAGQGGGAPAGQGGGAPAGQGGGERARRVDVALCAHAEDAGEVARALGVDPREGLTAAEARRRLRAVGPNELAGVATRSSIEILAGQIFTVPTAMLLGAAGVSLALGDTIDAGAVLLVVGANAAIGTYTESRAEELLHAWGDLRVGWARVVRDGREQRLAASEIVPGDVLALRAGEPVAADARVLTSRALAADESTLTGESEPAEKCAARVDGGAPLAERRGMVYAGTTIASGEGAAVVVATGRWTALGDIQRALSRESERTPPLEQELAWIGRRLATFALASSSAVMVVGLARRRPLRALLRSAVALGVAAIPEGFPTVGTTALALASRRLRGSGIVIRRLAAAETLGAVSVVCADKTGTLTENRMQVAEIFLPGEGALRVERAARRGGGAGPGRAIALIGEDGREVDAAAPRVHALARIAALNADVELSEAGKVVQGSGTERALVEFALAAGYPVSARRLAARRVSEARRSAERAFMVTVHDHPELGHIELVKGAPEQVVARCDAPPRREGAGDERGEVLRHNDAMASRGLRVLALAWRQNGRPDNDAPLEFAGLIGLRDPPRPGVREALEALSGAGIRTLMLTGDQERTARAIGVELGIPPDAVHSRVTPEAKLDIVRALQQGGAIVAMTGDGVNDGPALKAADVGVAMGKRGTDIARAVADVVLAEDDLPSLTEAVREGRRLHDNVRRAIAYFVATNASEVLTMLVGALCGASPLTPLQLLWINLLTDVAPALALALEPAEAGVMRRPPRDPAARLLGAADLRALGVDAAAMSGASLSAYALGGRATAGTRAFTALVTAQLLHILACRAGAGEGAAAAALRRDSPHVARALAATSALQALALGSGSLGRLLGAQRLRAGEIALAVAVGALPALLRGPLGRSASAGREIVIVNGRRAESKSESESESESKSEAESESDSESASEAESDASAEAEAAGARAEAETDQGAGEDAGAAARRKQGVRAARVAGLRKGDMAS
ncbi:cation-transporting P-type ATPase [Sorangium sp. So ce295]|uniref:HAD-IC family P-type ATPase n=1 Tax=Sorangium sp. So ce295 TaxID=3133295 RepID=UPI003F62BDBF